MRLVLLSMCIWAGQVLANTGQIVESSGVSVGSAVVVGTTKGLFAVTSEHVVGVLPLTLRINQVSSGLTLVHSDWAKGFAIYRLNDQSLSRVSRMFSDSELSKSAPVHPKEILRIEGYPVKTSGQPIITSGEVLVTSSSRSFLPDVSGIELINAHGEFGMSGGGVYSGDEFVGILSHQILNVKPGAASEVDVYRSSDQVAKHLFVIPREPIFKALRGLVGLEPKSTILALRYGQTQFPDARSRTSEIFIPPFLFQVEEPTIVTAKIGGDGAGIGGKSGSFPNSISYVKVGQSRYREETMQNKELIKSVAPLAPNPARDRLDWIAGWSSRDLTISSFAKRNPVTQNFERIYFSTMEEFVLLFRRADLIPIHEGSRTKPGDQSWQKLDELTRGIQFHLSKYRGRPSAELALHIHSLAFLVQNRMESLYSKHDFAELVSQRGRHRGAWRVLFESDYDLTVRLLADLYEIECILDARCKP
jgi:hypothetical protein